MTIPAVTKGRGAFTKIGKDNGKSYYGFVSGFPEDGASPEKDWNYQAVNLGVRAIQARVNSFGYSPALLVDGTYGAKTAAGVKWAQPKLGFTDGDVDGIAGPMTCRAMWHDYFIWFGGYYHVPASHLYGFTMLESAGDPGALGITTPSDRGLNQINENAHPNVTDEQAFDPIFSIDFTAKRLHDAREQFGGKSVSLQTYCSIAQHNSPLAAKQWYANGYAPNDTIQKYVTLVLKHAGDFK